MSRATLARARAHDSPSLPGFRSLRGRRGSPLPGGSGTWAPGSGDPELARARWPVRPTRRWQPEGGAPRRWSGRCPAARAALPSLLWPPSPYLCVRGVSPAVRDLTPGLAWPPAPLQVLGENCWVSSAAAAATRLAPSNFRRPVRYRRPEAGTGNKEAQAANGSLAPPGSRQSPSAARTFAAGARRRQGEGRGPVRGGALQSAIQYPWPGVWGCPGLQPTWW